MRAGFSCRLSLFFILLSVFLPNHALSGPVREKITLQWLGHACFLIHAERLTAPRPIPLGNNLAARPRRGGFQFGKEEFTLLIDPYGPQVGYPVHQVRADAVFITQEHPDHDNAAMAPGAKIYRGLKNGGKTWNLFSVDLAPGIHLTTVPAYHDEAMGKKRGLDSIAVLDVFGLRIVHLGDLGHLLTPGELKAIGKVDVLLIPVGGYFTIDGDRAKKVAAQLSPAIVIPIHYKTGYTSPRIPIADEREFLSGIRWPIKKPETGTLVFSGGNLPRATTVYVLQPLSQAPPAAP